jgi:hypothetical protein
MAFIVAAVLVYVFALPHLLGALVGLPFTVKLLISAALLVPLGLAMGMPFPSGLRALSGASATSAVERDETRISRKNRRAKKGHTMKPSQGAVEWAWAMNAASSVLGSVLAMVIALQFGLNITLACGAVAYLAAMALLTTFKQKVAGAG